MVRAVYLATELIAWFVIVPPRLRLGVHRTPMSSTAWSRLSPRVAVLSIEYDDASYREMRPT
jgi:hypothetical protein